VAGKDVVTGRSATQVKSKKIQFFQRIFNQREKSISARRKL